jgi:hypothetical protein
MTRGFLDFLGVKWGLILHPFQGTINSACQESTILKPLLLTIILKEYVAISWPFTL